MYFSIKMIKNKYINDSNVNYFLQTSSQCFNFRIPEDFVVDFVCGNTWGPV